VILGEKETPITTTVAFARCKQGLRATIEEHV